MRKHQRTRRAKTGLPPGSLVHVGERHAEELHLSLLVYNEKELHEKTLTGSEDLRGALQGQDKEEGVVWLHIAGLHDIGLMELLGSIYHLHPLTLEDILYTDQRPKIEDFGNYIYIVLKDFSLPLEADGQILPEQISVVFGPNFLISFQERQSPLLEPIRERIRSARGRIRKTGTDYLAYTIIDAIIDQYFILLEKLGENVESLEDQLVANPGRDTLHSIQSIKREMLYLRKSVWPLREAISTLQRSDSPLVDTATALYLKDVYDHAIQIIDTIETYRDMLSGMLDIYLSSVSNRLNEVMKVLTIIATIFMPLTFLAGVYGMNFKYMPELEWRWGYFMVLGIMTTVALSMVLFFRRKKWL
jgi:magnesium transporter